MKKTTFYFLLGVFFSFLSTTSFAQNIKGKVVDASTQQPLPGVTVVAVGTSKGTTTDANGAYTINKANQLKFSFVGYVSQTLSTNGKSEINVFLAEDAQKLQEIAVVGSRSGTSRTNVDKPVPVDIISPKELKGFSQVDVSQILNYVAPSFNSNRQTVSDGTDHVDPASLRGLGPDQVLVLVNGKRRHTSSLVNINGTVGRGSVGTDMNVIPVAAIQRIEVLRDGAAAQYGSDAIAGVINVVLKKDYEGLTASLTTGTNITSMNYATPSVTNGVSSIVQKNQAITDGQVMQFDISKGFRLGKEGALSVSAQYNERGKTNRSGEDNNPLLYLSGATTAASIAADKAIATQRNYDRHNIVYGNSSSRNIGIFANGYVPAGVNGQVYFSGGLTNRVGSGYGNPRIPNSRTQQPLKADGTLYYPNGFLPGIESTVNDQSLQLGYRTKFGAWKMDLSNTYGANSFSFRVFDSGNASLPNSDTQQTSFDAGKLKFTQNTTNLDFSRLYEKVGAIKALSLAFGAEFRQDNFAITAGELNSYFGNGRLVPTAPTTAGGVSPGTTVAGAGSQVFPGYQPTDAIDKSRTNLGIYADVEGELWNTALFGIAGRYENYSDFGSNFSGKFSTRIKLSQDVALRGSVSTGFRAPSLHQRYFQNTSTQFLNGLPSNTLTVNNDNSIARQTVGVDALRPETSVNLTAGLTMQLDPTTTLTIDAYQIDIKDRIVYSGGFSTTILGIAAQYPDVSVVRFFANAVNTRTQGVDLVASTKVPAGAGQLAFTLAMNYNKNEVTGVNSTALIDQAAKNDPTTNPTTWYRNLLFNPNDKALIESYQPQSKINLSATYSVAQWDFTLRTVRFGETKYVHNVPTNAQKTDGTYWNTIYNRDPAGAAYINQTFSALWLTDLVIGYKINTNFTLSVGSNNIFDVYPDQMYIDPRNGLGSVDYNAARDASNRGRLLFQPNQGGYNGRHVFARLVFNLPK